MLPVQKQPAKQCGVLGCNSNSELHPHLLFVEAPQTTKDPKLREKWLDAMRTKSLDRHIYCCSLHFKVPEDFKDFSNYISMAPGVVRRVLCVQDGILPHRNLPPRNTVTRVHTLVARKSLTNGTQPVADEVIDLSDTECDGDMNAEAEIRKPASERSYGVLRKGGSILITRATQTTSQEPPRKPRKSSVTYCRLCLGRRNLEPMFTDDGTVLEPKLLEKIIATTGVVISVATDFPSSLCRDCATIVNEIYQYQRMVSNNDKKLQNGQQPEMKEVNFARNTKEAIQRANQQRLDANLRALSTVVEKHEVQTTVAPLPPVKVLHVMPTVVSKPVKKLVTLPINQLLRNGTVLKLREVSPSRIAAMKLLRGMSTKTTTDTKAENSEEKVKEEKDMKQEPEVTPSASTSGHQVTVTPPRAEESKKPSETSQKQSNNKRKVTDDGMVSSPEPQSGPKNGPSLKTSDTTELAHDMNGTAAEKDAIFPRLPPRNRRMPLKFLDSIVFEVKVESKRVSTNATSPVSAKEPKATEKRKSTEDGDHPSRQPSKVLKETPPAANNKRLRHSICSPNLHQPVQSLTEAEIEDLEKTVESKEMQPKPTGGTDWKCPLCDDVTYDQKTHLVQHLRKRHGMEPGMVRQSLAIYGDRR